MHTFHAFLDAETDGMGRWLVLLSCSVLVNLALPACLALRPQDVAFLTALEGPEKAKAAPEFPSSYQASGGGSLRQLGRGFGQQRSRSTRQPSLPGPQLKNAGPSATQLPSLCATRWGSAGRAALGAGVGGATTHAAHACAGLRVNPAQCRPLPPCTGVLQLLTALHQEDSAPRHPVSASAAGRCSAARSGQQQGAACMPLLPSSSVTSRTSASKVITGQASSRMHFTVKHQAATALRHHITAPGPEHCRSTPTPFFHSYPVTFFRDHAHHRFRMDTYGGINSLTYKKARAPGRNNQQQPCAACLRKRCLLAPAPRCAALARGLLVIYVFLS